MWSHPIQRTWAWDKCVELLYTQSFSIESSVLPNSTKFNGCSLEAYFINRHWIYVWYWTSCKLDESSLVDFYPSFFFTEGVRKAHVLMKYFLLTLMKLAVTAQTRPRDTCETCCLQTLLEDDKGTTVRSQCVNRWPRASHGKVGGA